ncbi:PAS domain-containing protein [Ferrovibrio sp.]|uniref:PAS domain-containing protein n=1 Tax=Ferrovibrio sp. TaxID=1917215 RepID=UPI00262EE047|nr:PAS domain-containing protein [Ferrovibrio sp.]
MTGPNIGLVLDPDLGHLLPAAQDLLAYWQANCGTRGLPDRSAFDPIALRRYLGNLVIADIERNDHTDVRYRYRLVGTDLAERSGRDVTGRYFDELYDPTSLAEMKYCFGWVAEHKRPARIFGTFRHANRAYHSLDGLFLPIATSGGGDVNQVIGYIVPTS